MRKIIIFLFICLFSSAFPDNGWSKTGEATVIKWKDVKDLLDTIPSMRQSQEEVKAARAGINLAGQYPNPELGFTVGSEEARATSESAFIWGLEFEIPIESPGSIIMERRAAKEDFEAARHSDAANRLEAHRLLKTVFIQIAIENKICKSLSDNHSQLEQLVEFIRRRIEQGEARPMEQTRIEIELERAGVQLQAAEKKLQALRKSFNVSLGGKLPDDFEVEFDVNTLPDIPSLDKAIDYSKRKHPAILSAEHNLASATARTKAEKHQLFPDMTLGGFYNHEAEANNYGAMLNIELPLWNWNLGGIARASAEENAARYRQGALDRENQSAVCEAHATAEGARERAFSYAERILPKAHSNAENIQSMYRIGEINLMDVMDAKRGLIEIETETLTAISECWSAYFELMALTGDDNV